jgi:hypothetical protein
VGGTLLRTRYLATLVWPTSMPSLRSSPWILGAPHNGLATLIWRISWRISAVTAGRPQRCFDFHRQYDLNPARCQRITVSDRTIASAPYILGNSWQMPPNINLSIETNRSLLGLARRSTLICCLSTRISASSATRDRNRSLAIPKVNRHKSSIGYQHRAILSQRPARLNIRQGQTSRRGIPFVLRRMRLSTTTSDELSARLFGRLRRRRQHQRIFEYDDLTRAFSIHNLKS